jgi:hypothetical protein
VQTIRQLELLRQGIADLRGDGSRIALVPTMGALHAGHIALIEVPASSLRSSSIPGSSGRTKISAAIRARNSPTPGC